MLKKALHSFGIILAIFSAFWIIMGSTIMFHQVHVYNNHIDSWQIQAINIHGKDLKKVFQFIDNIHGHIIHLAVTNQDFVNEYGLVALRLNERTIYSRYLYDLISPEYIHDQSLRGPPVA
jgi:hypothetical protein